MCQCSGPLPRRGTEECMPNNSRWLVVPSSGTITTSDDLFKIYLMYLPYLPIYLPYDTQLSCAHDHDSSDLRVTSCKMPHSHGTSDDPSIIHWRGSILACDNCATEWMNECSTRLQAASIEHHHHHHHHHLNTSIINIIPILLTHLPGPSICYPPSVDRLDRLFTYHTYQNACCYSYSYRTLDDLVRLKRLVSSK